MKDLKQRRYELGMSRLRAAELVGTAYLNIANWETLRSRPEAHHFPKLCEVFRLTPEELEERIKPASGPRNGLPWTEEAKRKKSESTRATLRTNRELEQMLKRTA